MRVFLNMVGCRLNQAEIEQLAFSLVEGGVEVVSDPVFADIIVVNTCCVTAKAAADSRKMLRHHKANFPDARVLGTGCWISLPQAKSEIYKRIYDRAYDNSSKDKILNDLLEEDIRNGNNNVQKRPDLGTRRRTRGFVKVQDGCDNRCAYCLTQVVRGRSRSVPIENVISYLGKLQQHGVREAVLTGVQLGSWGKDLKPRTCLADLVKAILRETDVERIRLSSIEPWDVNPELTALFEDPRLCPHLHIPLQSGSAVILRSMNRPMTTERYQGVLRMVREVKPGIAITTDMICGFPGETEELYKQSLDFTESCGFSGGHVFPFSAMEGTAAFSMDGQVQNTVRQQRAKIMRGLFDKAEKAFAEQRLGTDVQVLFESMLEIEGEQYWQGWSEDFLKVLVRSSEDLRNLILKVHIQSAIPGSRLIGELETSCEDHYQT